MTESEWQTRKQRIDARLRSVNPPWHIVRYRDGLDFAALDCHAVEELPMEGLFTLADQLELRLTKAREQVDKLTPSLLVRAFAGKLVPQDHADKPAEELLERIRDSTKIKIK